MRPSELHDRSSRSNALGVFSPLPFTVGMAPMQIAAHIPPVLRRLARDFEVNQ